MYCDQSIFHSIRGNPQLVFKYWEMTRKEDSSEEIEREEKLVTTDLFGDDTEFKKDE